MRRRFAPHQLRHVHAVEMAREGVPLPVIQRQLGHAHLDVTSTYLQGIDTTEIINTVYGRGPPVIPASAGLLLEQTAPCRSRRHAAGVNVMKGSCPQAEPLGVVLFDPGARSGRSTS